MVGNHLNRRESSSVCTAEQVDTGKSERWVFAFEKPEYRKNFWCSIAKEKPEGRCKVVAFQVFL